MSTHEVGELVHEINSPLAALRNAIFLAAVNSDDANIRRYLELARDQARVIAKVIQDAHADDGVEISFNNKRGREAGCKS